MFGESEAQTDLLMLNSPVLTNAEFDAMRRYMGDKLAWIDCTFEAGEGHNELTDATDRIRREAEDAVRAGAVHLVLSDENTSPERAPVPMILVAGGVHSHLMRQKLRTFTSINVRSGECLDVHYFAVLIGVGATSINAYLAQESIAERQARGLFGDLSLDECCQRYRTAVDAGLLKILSKMGISVLGSYRGAYNFEAVGLSRALVAEFFPGMSSRVSGIGLSGIKQRVLALHHRAHDGTRTTLPVGGIYKARSSSEVHAFDGLLIHMLQHALAGDSYATYKKYTAGVNDMPPVHVRDLLGFKPHGEPVALEEVESTTEIRKRFMSGSMSHGALSREAHETLAIAMNRIGAASCSGEGGEDPARYEPRPNGDNANSAVKQIASGRFGVTAEYLNRCREIEIKMAQGAKPGEGGQLPGFKVSEEIARLRYATEGVTLISPPPHHDIYSIEDLAQLIYDLKQINPQARVSVKLVAEAGIGTISAGVAKAKADIILISGHDGGTGASPQSSLKYAGVPWEMSLAEINQVLTLNRLRHTTTLRVDGGIKTGRDVVIAAMLGAEEFGVGTASLVAMGCLMVRQCHSNTCPVGICTQDEALRAKFEGTPEKVINLFSFIAEEVREFLALLGVRTLDEIVGRSDMLRQVSRGSRDLDDLDLNPLLVQADPGGFKRTSTRQGRNEVPESLDEQMIRDADDALEVPEKMQLAYTVRNTHRTIGAKLSSNLWRRFGMTGLQADYFTVSMRGTAGQSLGAFAVQGLKLEVTGDANDYVGKGLSGGTIVLKLATSSPLVSNENAIIGNTVLYGATAGKLFAAGQAGERFCVRNSGALAVVEGCGSNGCEYMTGGIAVILGPVGDNFAAGMTGGMAFVYDTDGSFEHRVNSDSVIWQRIQSRHWEGVCRDLVREHYGETQTRFSERLLADWTLEAGNFWQICPKEMISRISHPLSDETAVKTA
jgi:glutamate synthase (NADPH/NADH) large chain